MMRFRAERVPAIEVPLMCLHVYRIGGVWSSDKVVRADDRMTVRYYLKATRLDASWQFALHAGGPHGMLLCHAKSPYVGPPMMGVGPGPISITIGPERDTTYMHRGHRSSGITYSFRGLDDKEYRWRPRSRTYGSIMECVDDRDRVVATYRVTLLAISKDGELRIYQSAQSMADLVVATCLAMRTPDH